MSQVSGIFTVDFALNLRQTYDLITIKLRQIEKMNPLNRPRIRNRKNKTWLHFHRKKILSMLASGATLQEIADDLASSATEHGKKVSKQIISSYVLRYPPEQSTDWQPPKAESPTAQVAAPANATAATAPTTEKKINPSLAALRERRKAQAESEPQQPNAEPENVPKSKNPLRKLEGKVGRSEPDSDTETRKYKYL